jgi:exodeoxyribonuclease V beta subunit
LDARYKHILIDEFQDTSVEQFNIILPLIEESLGGNPNDFRTFFYVGDTKQSIYRFRGGKRELFDYVINFYPQIEELNLDTNYRSKKEVVEFVNDTFLKVPNYEYINQKSISNGGYVEVVTDIGLDGDSPYSGVLEKIKFMRQSGVDLDNLAILVSTNEEVLNLYYYLMESDLNYPITTEMSSKLINQQNVKALINAVKYIFFQENIYKINTLALLGKDTQDSLELDIDIKNISLQKALKDIANSLNITDENIIKLIELSDQFGDIFDFVYEIDNLDASMTSPEKIGISILTIFKSKGLEYESVIVLDKLKRDSHSSEAFLFEYDKIALNHIHYKIKNKELFDEDYAKALLKEAELQRIDTINVLYVALTRAKHNLFVIKKEKNSIFDVLGLGDMQRGKLEASSNAKVSNKDKIQIHYNLINMGIQDIKLKTYSEDFGDLRSKYYGIATHFCLENGQTFHPSEIQTLVDLSKQRFLGILSINDFQQITKSLESLFENNTFKELIKDAKYLKTEQPLIYNGEIKYLDLLIIKENEYIVVDYKTSKTHHDIYIKQVSTYKKAIKKITNNSNIKGYIIYLHPDSTDFCEV